MNKFQTAIQQLSDYYGITTDTWAVNKDWLECEARNLVLWRATMEMLEPSRDVSIPSYRVFLESLDVAKMYLTLVEAVSA
jgi:hypothetical protein